MPATQITPVGTSFVRTSTTVNRSSQFRGSTINGQSRSNGFANSNVRQSTVSNRSFSGSTLQARSYAQAPQARSYAQSGAARSYAAPSAPRSFSSGGYQGGSSYHGGGGFSGGGGGFHGGGGGFHGGGGGGRR